MEMLSDYSIRAYLRLHHTQLSLIRRRAPRPTPFQGSRALHLVHNLFVNYEEIAKAQLATITRKIYPRAKEISLKLVDKGSNEVATMTLSQALQRLKPLDYLAEAGPKVYCIKTFPDPGPVEILEKTLKPKCHKPFTRAGRGKELHLTTSCTPAFLRHVLALSYKYILQGTRMEFHLHQKANGSGGRTVDWALANCMHLRPDSILAAMPKGTTMLAVPGVTDMTFKKRPPKNINEAKSQVMWAVENRDVMKRVSVTTPRSVKMLGKWPIARITKLSDGTSNADIPIHWG
ncbi:MAG: hypothetical protein ASARMPREDX12_007392 [Alectoria sarmentosa]|nr:MAG: hypothetical protein ASARMPREDX12_007392 [Alectoria sarmentosa]CAD6587400.1 MAG: hypothetical protein ASARMPRED_003086 [Alectoria sarmentosa]